MEIMVDIETLSSENDAVVTSIGAVKFDLRTQQSVEQILANGHFSAHLSAEDQEKKGRKVSVSTALWWMQQNEHARKDLIDGQKGASAVNLNIHILGQFRNYCIGASNLWGNGNTFDNMVLRSLYKTYEEKYPVSFRNDLDFRTLKYMAKLKFPDWTVPYPKYGEFKDTAHVGYIDAACQAYSAQRIWAKLNNQEVL